ncbi:MAG: DUF4012 domain-containing protein [Chloroflexota bacterium]
MTTNNPPHPPPLPSTTRLVRTVILLGLTLLLLWLGLKGCRVARAVNNLQSHQDDAETLLADADGLTDIDPAAAAVLVQGIRRDVLVLQRETAVFMPLAPYLGWLPRIGPLVQAAPQLMTMAEGGTRTAVFAYQGLQPALALLTADNNPTAPLPALVEHLAAAQPDLIQAELALNQVVAARQALPREEELPWRVRTLLAQADEWLPLGQRGLQIAQVLPDVMGHDEPRRYLILAQNEDELRATGGFLSGAGVLVIEQGQIVQMDFQDANRVDAWAETGFTLTKPYDFAPQPYYDFMGIQPFLFRDANFWPDFPTSSEQAIALYEYGQDDLTPFAGVIAIDQYFLQLLVAATGPVQLEDGQTITSGNLLTAMRAAWNDREADDTTSDWLRQRKDFLGTFAQALRQKLEGDIGDIDLLLLVQNMDQAAQGRHIQIYLRNMDEAAAVIDRLSWNGRLPNKPHQDTLMVVESNFGYNKVNSLIERSTTYAVDLGQMQADTRITFTHRGPDEGDTCDQTVNYTIEIRYEQMVNRCYWNFLRLYTPHGSTLIEASRHPAPATAFIHNQAWSGDAYLLDDPSGLTTIANFLLLEWGETAVVHTRYQLPASVIQTTDGTQAYKLTIYKQGGLPPQPLTVTITLPANAQLVNAEPKPTSVNDQTVTFDTTLASDLQFMVTYR